MDYWRISLSGNLSRLPLGHQHFWTNRDCSEELRGRGGRDFLLCHLHHQSYWNWPWLSHSWQLQQLKREVSSSPCRPRSRAANNLTWLHSKQSLRKQSQQLKKLSQTKGRGFYRAS